MLRFSPIALLFLLVLLTAGCDGCEKSTTGCPDGTVSCGQACETPAADSACGNACSLARPCPSGFYCGGEDMCVSDCNATLACPEGATCSSNGKCVPATMMSDATIGNDGFVVFDATFDDSGVCARQRVNATRVTPNVIFIVDRSGSMRNELDLSNGVQCGDNNCEGNNAAHSCYCGNNDRALSRWQSLRSVLVGNGNTNRGLVGSLEDSVRFGMALYSSEDDECPSLARLSEGAGDTISVAPVGQAIDTFAAAYLMRSPRNGTPTGAAVEYVRTHLDTTITGSSNPTIFILATDGEPATCEDLGETGTTEARNETVSEVLAAFNGTSHIRTFVISVADPSELDQGHIDQIANVGIGQAATTTPPAKSWPVTSTSGLEDALNEIIGSQISCEVTLQGTVTDITGGCAGGEVAMVAPNGTRTPIPCDATNGWNLTSNTTLEVFGSACNTLKGTAGVSLDASFPCGSVVIID